MDNTTSSNNSTSNNTTPFPNGGARQSLSNTADSAHAAVDKAADKASDAAAAAAPIVDRLIKRATTSAHDAVDGIAAKVTSLTDGLQDGVSKVGDTRDEWVESARDAIRQHPFAAIAGALVIGAALVSLRSSNRD